MTTIKAAVAVKQEMLLFEPGSKKNISYLQNGVDVGDA